ncbi:hypothetical protein BG000_002517 [Podila horticola]|nr:hypothetical protein BG000_002517 [Podila horticola]
MKLDAISSVSSGHTPSHRQPFAAGSLLQQRAEAEKQEIENMKLQLRLREQAGVLGAKNFNSVDPPAGYYLHRPNGGLTGITGSNSANSLSSMSSSSLLSQQPLKFGGPGTLIEKGEARAAQLLERSKSAGTGLLHPPANIGHSSYSRSRSKSRGPGEDRSGHYSGSSSPRSTGSVSSAASPNGPLLHFEDENAMIKPGLLLDRAKSAKQASGMGLGGYSRGYSSNGAQAGSRGRQASSSSNNTAHSSNNGRTRVKPLIDLGNIHTGQDLIGPGLLTAHSSRPAPSGAQSARSPRRNKPLLEF